MKKAFNDDTQLLLAIKAGNHLALTQIFEEMFPFLCDVAYFIIKDKLWVEDMATEAIRKTLAVSENFDSLWELKVYMKKTVKHDSLNFIRDLKTRKRIHSEAAPVSEPSEDTTKLDLIRADLIRAINEEIATFKNRDQLIARYSLFSPLMTKEITEKLEMNAQTFRNRWNTLKKALRKYLDDNGLITFIIVLSQILS